MTPDGWDRVKLRDLGDGVRPAIKAGPFGSALKKSIYVASGYRVYGQEQVIAGDFSKGDYFIDEEKFAALRSCEVRPGDVLVSLVGTFGKVAIVPKNALPGIINPRLLRLSPDRSRVDPAYLKVCLESSAVQSSLGQAAQGGTMGVLNASTLGPVEILLPPLPEQRKIAAILSSVDDAIEGTQAVIDQLQVVKKAMMAELLTRGLPGRHTRFKQTEIGEVPERWPLLLLEDVTSRITYGFTNPMPTTHTGPWMVTAANVRDGWIDWDSVRHTDADAYERLLTDKSRPSVNDVLITKDGTLGRIALLERGNVCMNQSVASLRPIPDRVSPAFLGWVMRGPQMQERIIGDSGGSTIKHIYISKLAKTPVPIPPMDEQLELVSMFGSIEARVSAEQESISTLLEAKNSLMSVLLTGEVRVTPDEDLT